MKKILLLLCFGLCASAWAQVEKNEPSELDKEFVEQIKIHTGIQTLGVMPQMEVTTQAYHITHLEEKPEEDIITGFRIDFSSNRQGFEHTTFVAYCETIWDQCKMVAKNSEIFAAMGVDAGNPCYFAGSANVPNIKERRMQYAWYYKYKEETWEVVISEQKCKATGDSPEVRLCNVTVDINKKAEK